MYHIPIATGCQRLSVPDDPSTGSSGCSVLDYGASPDADPTTNTRAFDRALLAASSRRHGIVIVPQGRFLLYSIHLRNGIRIHLEKGAVLAAARTDIRHGICDVQGESFRQRGQGGNYDEPEINRYAGLQDHAHSYLRNSLILGEQLHDVAIEGPGRIDGSWTDENGFRRQALTYADPALPDLRNSHGHDGEWFGNKAIALHDCQDVTLSGFEILAGGHFAVIATGCRNLLVEGLTIDTNRDGIDLDSVEDVTVRGCRVNSPHDDAIVVKASYATGRFAPSHNILIENCQVSGYDLGSVLNGHPSVDRVSCHPGIGPIGRIKLGTEATCGYERVTIRKVAFRHCFGLAIEATDGSDVRDVRVEDVDMVDVTCPLFIRTGDRARFPVTGRQRDERLSDAGRIRLDDTNWVLPDRPGYDRYPARRYAPAHRFQQVTMPDGNRLRVVDQRNPIRLNPANWWADVHGARHPWQYDRSTEAYLPDMDRVLTQQDAAGMGNAIGAARCARAVGISVSRLHAIDVEPRYPIILAGCLDGRLENIQLKDFTVQFRGGLSMRDAVEQRCFDTHWKCAETDWPPVEQRIHWMAEPHGDDAMLLPRVRWDPQGKIWQDDPFNVPEGVRDYPEPVQFGILPAYGLYARHVDDLVMDGIDLSTDAPDERASIVLDDVAGGQLKGLHTSGDRPSLVLVEDRCKRRTGFECLPDEPFRTTRVKRFCMPSGIQIQTVRLTSPEPGTPPDHQYPYPTVADAASGYHYKNADCKRFLARVHPPYFLPIKDCKVTLGETLTMKVPARDPAPPEAAQAGPIYLEEPPEGARCEHGWLTWRPSRPGRWTLTFRMDKDGMVIREHVRVEVLPGHLAG